MLIKIPQNYRYFEDHSGKLFQEIFQHISLSSIKIHCILYDLSFSEELKSLYFPFLDLNKNYENQIISSYISKIKKEKQEPDKYKYIIHQSIINYKCDQHDLNTSYDYINIDKNIHTVIYAQLFHREKIIHIKSYFEKDASYFDCLREKYTFKNQIEDEIIIYCHFDQINYVLIIKESKIQIFIINNDIFDQTIQDIKKYFKNSKKLCFHWKDPNFYFRIHF